MLIYGLQIPKGLTEHCLGSKREIGAHSCQHYRATESTAGFNTISSTQRNTAVNSLATQMKHTPYIHRDKVFYKRCTS